MHKVYKYRLYPTTRQIQKLNRTLAACRILYNFCLLERESRGGLPSKKRKRLRTQQAILNRGKAMFSFLSEVHPQVLQDVSYRVDRSLQNFIHSVSQGEKRIYPKAIDKDDYPSITYTQQPGFKLTTRRLKLSKVGAIKIKLHRPIIGAIKTCTIKKEVDKWYTYFLVEYIPIIRPVPEKSIGIDMGIKSFAVFSDGITIDNPRYLFKSEKKLIRKRRQLSRKVKGSQNEKKVKKAVAKLLIKIRNQRTDFHHKLSRKIVDSYGFIAIENLQIKNLLKNRYLAKSISDASWGQFFTRLIQKATEAGCRVKKVAPQYTSIICSVCGKQIPKTLTIRIHKCDYCNVILDRDHNAAINILNRAGTARINACGEVSSLNQEALSDL